VIGHIRRADGAEENRVECLQLLETAFGDVLAVLLVVRAAPRKLLDVQPESAIALREHFEHFEPRGDHFDADAIAGDGCDPVFAHEKIRVTKSAHRIRKARHPPFRGAGERPLG
jgi:hypothetical protein